MPSPEELVKYKDIDANLVSKFIEFGEKEQEHRHRTNLEYLELDKQLGKHNIDTLTKQQKHDFRMENFFNAIIVLLIFIFGGASFYFINEGKNIQGEVSIIINIGLIIRVYFYIPEAAALLLKLKSKKTDQNNKDSS